jgi:hypothetical protein
MERPHLAHTLFFRSVLKADDNADYRENLEYFMDVFFQPRLSSQRQSQISFAPRLPVRSICQLDRSSMGLSDLLREYKADSSTARLGRVKRYKQVAGVG